MDFNLSPIQEAAQVSHDSLNQYMIDVCMKGEYKRSKVIKAVCIPIMHHLKHVQLNPELANERAYCSAIQDSLYYAIMCVEAFNLDAKTLNNLYDMWDKATRWSTSKKTLEAMTPTDGIAFVSNLFSTTDHE